MRSIVGEDTTGVWRRKIVGCDFEDGLQSKFINRVVWHIVNAVRTNCRSSGTLVPRATDNRSICRSIERPAGTMLTPDILVWAANHKEVMVVEDRGRKPPARRGRSSRRRQKSQRRKTVSGVGMNWPTAGVAQDAIIATIGLKRSLHDGVQQAIQIACLRCWNENLPFTYAAVSDGISVVIVKVERSETPTVYQSRPMDLWKTSPAAPSVAGDGLIAVYGMIQASWIAFVERSLSLESLLLSRSARIVPRHVTAVTGNMIFRKSEHHSHVWIGFNAVVKFNDDKAQATREQEVLDVLASTEHWDGLTCVGIIKSVDSDDTLGIATFPVGHPIDFHSHFIHASAMGNVIKELKVLHEVGYVHRDIRLSNIVYRKPSLMLIDYGLAVLNGKS